MTAAESSETPQFQRNSVMLSVAKHLARCFATLSMTHGLCVVSLSKSLRVPSSYLSLSLVNFRPTDFPGGGKLE